MDDLRALRVWQEWTLGCEIRNEGRWEESEEIKDVAAGN